jgi:hypothetical protein
MCTPPGNFPLTRLRLSSLRSLSLGNPLPQGEGLYEMKAFRAYLWHLPQRDR